MKVNKLETIKLTYPHTLRKDQLPETIAAIGFFDGLHKGHVKVIKEAVKRAQLENKTSAVISFFPHPSIILKKATQPIQYITLLEEKQTLLKEIGVDRFYLITFNEELSQLSPKQFIDHFVHDLHITHIFAGFDFTFGHKGKGTIDNLHTFTNHPLETTKIAPVMWKEEPISSTLIRKLIQNGHVDEVQQLLGRPYETIGTVIQGDSRGHKIGFPTANLQFSTEKLLPKRGVYGVKVYYDGKEYEGMTNIGIKPTFTDTVELSVEVHIFHFDRSIYGEVLQVQWYTYVRDEQKFNGIEEIVAQLKQDEQTVKQFFSKR